MRIICFEKAKGFKNFEITDDSKEGINFRLCLYEKTIWSLVRLAIQRCQVGPGDVSAGSDKFTFLLLSNRKSMLQLPILPSLKMK